MAITARTVRWALLATALVLVAVILGFAGYAHYRSRLFLLGLPHKLGVNIKQETNGFTYSQSVAGRTVFTVHASKEIQRTDGRITLHDVGITLYGRTPGSADRIHGSDFEFDPANGVLTAAGEVYLDLEAPAGSFPAQPNGGTESRMIHVKTSGLTFLEKERTANTDQAIEFSAGGLSGRAVGASYDSTGGLVVLKNDVEMRGLRGGRPLTLTASRAEVDRNANMVRLTTSTAAQTTANGVERLSAQQSVVQLTADGAPRTLEAQGHVLFARDGRGTLSGNRLQAEFRDGGGTKGSVLRRAHLSGEVHFQDDTLASSRQGKAADMNVLFDSVGRAERVDLNGGVRLESHRGAVTQTLVSSRVQLAFQTMAAGRSVLQGAEAFGENGSPARLRLIAPQSKGAPGQTATDVAAQHLRAQFTSAGKTVELKTLDGEGQAAIQQTATGAGGAQVSDESSTGDSLHAEFTRGADGRMLLARAEQHGHVTGVRQVAAHLVKGREIAAEMERYRADNAAFDAESNRVRFTGAVEIADPSSELFADKVALDRGSGVATADGAVRASYVQPGGKGEPLHITAARAESDKGSGLTKFFGASANDNRAPGKDARLWQGGSQVEAGEIDFNRAARQVFAKGDGGLMRAVLANTGPANSGMVRIASRELTYTDATRQVELTGAVKLTQGEGSLQSASAVVFLAQSGGAGAQKAGQVSGAVGLMGGKVERIVAEGDVQLEQPGRKATGTKLLYTAADQTYTLTGTKTAPPRLMDETRGTITGASLRFRGGDDSVEILGSQGQRVESQTRVEKTTKRK